MLSLRNESIILNDKDEDHEMQIIVTSNIKVYEYECYINKDQAIQIINHLKEQFDI